MKKLIATASALVLLTLVTNAQIDSAAPPPHRPPHFKDNNQPWKDRRGGDERDDHQKGHDMVNRWGRPEEGRDGHQGPERDMAKRWGHERKERGFGKPPIVLTEEQRKQSKIIHEDFEKQTAELYNNDKLKVGDLKKKLGELRKQREDKLATILTPEQRTKKDSFNKKRDEDRQVMQAAHLERMKIDLGLKDEQVASMKAAQTKLHDQMKALHEDYTLFPEQKREKMKTLMEQQKETVKTILTPEQLNKLEAHKKPRGEWKG